MDCRRTVRPIFKFFSPKCLLRLSYNLRKFWYSYDAEQKRFMWRKLKNVKKDEKSLFLIPCSHLMVSFQLSFVVYQSLIFSCSYDITRVAIGYRLRKLRIFEYFAFCWSFKANLPYIKYANVPKWDTQYPWQPQKNFLAINVDIWGQVWEYLESPDTLSSQIHQIPWLFHATYPGFIFFQAQIWHEYLTSSNHGISMAFAKKMMEFPSDLVPSLPNCRWFVQWNSHGIWCQFGAKLPFWYEMRLRCL